jgi:hypothetical protein
MGEPQREQIRRGEARGASVWLTDAAAGGACVKHFPQRGQNGLPAVISKPQPVQNRVAMI